MSIQDLTNDEWVRPFVVYFYDDGYGVSSKKKMGMYTYHYESDSYTAAVVTLKTDDEALLWKMVVDWDYGSSKSFQSESAARNYAMGITKSNKARR